MGTNAVTKEPVECNGIQLPLRCSQATRLLVLLHLLDLGVVYAGVVALKRFIPGCKSLSTTGQQADTTSNGCTHGGTYRTGQASHSRTLHSPAKGPTEQSSNLASEGRADQRIRPLTSRVTCHVEDPGFAKSC